MSRSSTAGSRYWLQPVPSSRVSETGETSASSRARSTDWAKPGAESCAGRDVDVQRQRLHPGEAEVPRPQLAAGARQDALTDGHDEAGLLRERQVVARRDRAQQRVAPADERLDGGDGATLEVDDGLVLHPELVALDGALQLALQVEGVAVQAVARHGGHLTTRPHHPVPHRRYQYRTARLRGTPVVPGPARASVRTRSGCMR